MKLNIRKLQCQKGISFLELMIALAIMGIVTMTIFRLFVTQHNNYIAQDDVSIIQQNARASIDELSRHIRMAGHRLPLGLAPISSSNTNPDTITITYRTDDCETYLSATMGSPSSEMECGSSVSCFRDGQWIFILEPDSGGGEWFQIAEVKESASRILPASGSPSKAYAADAVLLSMTQIKFFVDDVTSPDHPTLMVQVPGRAPQPFAEDVEDLQFRYRMKNGMVLEEPAVPHDIREVMISISGRSSRENIAMEPVAGNDPYRRRTFTTSVFLRNVGI